MNKLFFCVLALSALLLGCKPAPPADVPVPEPDELRILSTVTAADYLLVKLGCADKIMAIDRHGRIVPELSKVPTAVAGATVSREWLKKLRINMAFVWYYQQHLADFLRREGIAVWVVEPLRIGSYPAFLRKMGDLTGRKEAVQVLLSEWEQLPLGKTDKVLKSCYIELYAPWRSAGADAYLSEILQAAGGRNASPAARDGVVSPEAVRRQDVEVIFYIEGFGDAGEIARRPALRNTQAVRDQRIYPVPRQLAAEGVAPMELWKYLKARLEF